jgi:hypothetical protein
MKRYLFLIVLIIFALSIRFVGLVDEDVWLDEAIDMHNAWKADLWTGVYDSVAVYHYPFNVVLLSIIGKLFTNLVFAARCLSAIAGSMAIFVFFFLCQQIDSIENKEKTIFPYVATAFFSLSSELLYFSQEVRSYIFVILFSVLSFVFYFRIIIRSKNNIDYAGYALSTLMLLYTDFLAGLIIFVQNIGYFYFYIVNYRRNITIKKWISLQIYIGVFYTPLFYISSKYLLKGATTLWWGVPNIKSLGQLICDLLHFGFIKIDILLRVFLIVLIVVYLLRMFYSFFYKKASQYNERYTFILLLIWFTLPIAILFILSHLGIQVFLKRYCIIVLVPLFIFVGKGFMQIPTRVAKITIFTIIICMYFHSYSSWFKSRCKEPYRKVCQYITQNRLDNKNNKIFIANDWYAQPFLCNIDMSKFKIANNFSDITKTLESNGIYPYCKLSKEFIDESNPVDVYVLSAGLALQKVELDDSLRKIKYLYFLDKNDFRQITLYHYLCINSNDKIINVKDNKNIIIEKNITNDLTYSTVYPSEREQNAYIVYKILCSEKLAKRLFLCVKAYAIYKNNSIRLFIGNDLKNMKLLLEVNKKDEEQKYINMAYDVSSFACDNKELLIKIEIFVNKDSRELWDVRLEGIDLIYKN